MLGGRVVVGSCVGWWLTINDSWRNGECVREWGAVGNEGKGENGRDTKTRTRTAAKAIRDSRRRVASGRRNTPKRNERK